jgi:predicted unusual protein kinase regulating ubiquinone biosynthesis (AarF/ABC1/UbiB family)
MELTVVRLYHPALWKILWSYRAVLVMLRSIENLARTLTYVLVQGPFLIAWTRFPMTRERRPPLWRPLAEVVAPLQARASISVGGGQLGSNFALATSTTEMSNIQRALVDGATPPSGIHSVLGSFLRGMFTAMGPAFIKFGQILSMREELPHAIRIELSLLQDRLPPMPFKTVQLILERELDRSLAEAFEWVEETPIATASLAQVHRAKLRKEQAEVALKIQRPYLQGTVVLDTIYLCDIVLWLVQRLLPTFSKGADFGCFTTSYRESLAKEIDFNLEERNQSKFRKLIMDHPLYSQAEVVAQTHREYTTTKLLTMELVKNYYRLDRIFDELTPEALRDFANTKLNGLPPEIPLQLIWIQIAIQIEGLSHWGISHGDVHLGNLYAVAPEREGAHWRVFLCDFGMMIEETEPERIVSIESLSGLCYYWDGGLVGQCLAIGSLRPMSQKNHDKLISIVSRVVDKYFVEVAERHEKMWYPQIQRGSKVTVVSELVYGAATLGMKMTPFNWQLLKNMAYLCNMGSTMWTSFNPTNMSAPHCKKFVKDVVLHDLDYKNVTNLRDSLPQLLSTVREHDRRQILAALDGNGPVEPLKPLWTHDWDLRQLPTPEVAAVPDALAHA